MHCGSDRVIVDGDLASVDGHPLFDVAGISILQLSLLPRNLQNQKDFAFLWKNRTFCRLGKCIGIRVSCAVPWMFSTCIVWGKGGRGSCSVFGETYGCSGQY